MPFHLLNSTARLRPAIIALALLGAMYASYAQDIFSVKAAEGTAKVQRSQRREWTKLATGDRINDNDIIETFFQSRVILEYGNGNVVIIGPNSKALLNLAIDRRTGDHEFSATLFVGGLFVKNISHSKANVFTSNGVAQSDSGAISAVFEAKNGYTGFQILGGAAKVRNVAQQEAHKLSSGQTTIIQHGKKPAAPLYITRKHVNVLKHFFGNEYIEHQMQVANINPTEERSPGSRLGLARDATSATPQVQPDLGMYKALFSINQIYGSILEDQKTSGRSYRRITKPTIIANHRMSVAAGANFGIVNSRAYPVIYAAPGFASDYFKAALRLPFASDVEGMSLHFNGAGGILDKLDYLMIGNQSDSMFLYAGPLEKVTFANGLVVENLANQNPYSAVKTVGALGQLKNKWVGARLFLFDVAKPKIGGIHFQVEPGITRFGLGYYFDFMRYEPLSSEAYSRYTSFPRIDDHSPSAEDSPSYHFFEANCNVDAHESYDRRLALNLDIALLFSANGLEGFGFNCPAVAYEWSKFRFDAGLHFSSGKFIRPYFHSFYASNRRRLVGDSSGQTLQTQGNHLHPERQAYGFNAAFGAMIIPGLSLDWFIQHDFGTKYSHIRTRTRFNDSTNSLDSIEVKSKKRIQDDFGFELSLSADSALIPKIIHAGIYLRQVHGGYYPQTGSYFKSWGFELGGDLITAPLFYNISLEAGGTFHFLDLDLDKLSSRKFNNEIDAGDNVVEFRLGLRWGI